MKTRYIIVGLMMLLGMTTVQAQIVIGGSVYGGGNAGVTEGNTKVTVYEGDLNEVYGGARMADVKGNAFVHIDGEHASDYILINKVYGGNDISGTISATNATVPDELTQKSENNIDNTWDAFVRISTKTKKTGEGENAIVEETSDAKKIYIGQLFGGGNGNYIYSSEADGNDVIHILKDAETGNEILRTEKDIHQPDLGKTYLELLGGSIVNVFGGGNMATVTEDVVIHLDNPSKVVNHIKVKDGKEDDDNGTDLLTEDRFKLMGINYKFTYPNSGSFQFGNLFGGNNKVDMTIQPKWNLLGGKVRNLYSGGNEGRMTCPQGLLLQIPEKSTIVVDNVYGGCRKADVRPLDAEGNDVPNAQIQLVENPTGIPAGFSARTRILGGNINNVYGGNDISGNVYGGNTVAILTTIHGNVYGGGNGSYAYTDNPALKNELLWRDFYYNPKEILGLSDDATFTGLQSAEALNKVRPNAEQVSLLLRGKEDKPVFVEGSVFVGGNSASLQELTEIPNRQAHVKIGSYVTIDNLFLGNNGENMVKTNAEVRDDEEGLIQAEGVLKTIASTDIASDNTKFNSMVLTETDVFDKYMEGCAMKLMPSVVFDDVENYEDYSSQFGSFYCGGNVGSMLTDGLTEINFEDKAIIYEKIVGGCNRANVVATDYNAAYYGGLLGNPDSNGDKLKLNFSDLKIQPMRWKDPTDKTQGLEWNTVRYDAGTQSFVNVDNVAPTGTGQNIQSDANDIIRRLKGGNIYGGCYESGHVNGNVILNINETLMERDRLFDLTDEGDILYENTEKGEYTIKKRNTGVILSEQGMDVLGDALNVFGGGYGKDSEIWGSATVNLNKGYVFQIFGGGEAGAIGKKDADGMYGIKNADGTYGPDEKYSTYINLRGENSGVPRNPNDDADDGMAECEFIYGGGFEGVIAGSTHINLGNGRIFNSFAGSCNADILGHTETFVGRQWTKHTNGTYSYVDGGGFPWIRDHIYGGNDLGGLIKGYADFTGRIRDEVKSMVSNAYKPKSATYMEYIQGRVGRIFGGCFGDYDYSDAAYQARVTDRPYLHNSFVNIRPNNNVGNSIDKVFGAGEGCPADREGDKSQDHSYVLIDIPAGIDNFAGMEIFGGGAYNGLGMRYTPDETFAKDFDLDEASAVIDLMRGQVSAAYGGSYEEGIIRRTAVNVPVGSTAKINRIFGGAYGTQILPPCDVYESHVNYRSGDACVTGAIYGGNNNERRTLYAKINISAPVWSDKEKGYTATVYGAGRGVDTWAEYTEVNLESGANVYEVYGGGEEGHVLNSESVQAYMRTYIDGPSADVLEKDPDWETRWNGNWADAWRNAWTFGEYYHSLGEYTRYVHNANMNLNNTHLVRTAEMDDRQGGYKTNTYNTNVIIHEGATVSGYVYGGGYGISSKPMSGDVYGTTYVALLGGTVGKDIYAAGTSGAVYDLFGVGEKYDGNVNGGFIASANIYVKGGTVRNVYGGGWEGDLGYHNGKISDVANNATDRDGEAHVVIGVAGDDNFFTGAPAITRNVYGGGEGGSVFGKSYIKMNNGYIGYCYKNAAAEGATPIYKYVEELDDNGTDISRGGNIFGGGYVANSYTDASDIVMYGGTVRGCLYGGGEIGPIGRGSALVDAPAPDGTIINAAAKIYKGGSTSVILYDGHVMRDVFGGGRGYDNWYGNGTKYMKDEVIAVTDFSSKGYVFGSTDVHIRGGEIGTEEGVLQDFGNVFAGGNEGFVFSAIGKKKGTKVSDDELTDGIPTEGGGYYYKNGVIANGLTRDCSAVVEPYCKVIADGGITIDGKSYAKGAYVPVEALNKLGNKNNSPAEWAKIFKGDNTDGIVIHNAVFAGGNTREGSDNVAADTYTVFGNASVSVRDVYNRDLITIGTDDIGGVYGDGNMTFVDGFREVHVDNYGTDYYYLDPTMDYEAYQKLTEREKAYYQLKYVTKTTHIYNYYESRQLHTDSDTDVTYRKGQKITGTEYNALSDKEKVYWTAGSKVYQAEDQIEEGDYTLMDDVEKANWELGGVCSRYAGRPMNTIQRADMCGVFGSRLVLKGAEDRVKADDYNSYTINRVDELSLNRRNSQYAGDTGDNAVHGNYFGIYSSVNYLGNLTSDVFFTETSDPNDPSHSAVRQTDVANGGIAADGKTTYYEWKVNDPQSKYRNNGISQNKVALASGVYLEIKREEGEALGEDKWGYVTGVIELDLINVMPGMGGGYVYAKNEHGIKQWHPEYGKVTLLEENLSARTYRKFTYAENNLQVIETSGNFVHNTKQIVDDCYPNGGIYNDGYVKSPAHYWFIKGSIYVYDQYISAYTGTANAYAEKVELPLTISAASNGRMTLREVQPNYYAYYDKNGRKMGDEDADDHFEVNNVSYKLNDPISYWDYRVLSETDQTRFVEETYVTIAECVVGDKVYPEGYTMLPDEYQRLRNSAPKKQLDGEDSEAVPSVYHVEQEEDVAFDFVFRQSNNLSHETGYVLTYDINNPMIWNNYFTKTTDPTQASRLNTEEYENASNKGDYTEGPTFTPKAGMSGVYGQRQYKKGEVVYGTVYSIYQSLPDEVKGKSGQAQVERAYIMTSEHIVNDANGEEVQHLYPGTSIYKSNYTDAQWAALNGKMEKAQVCTNLLEFSSTDYVYAGQLLSTADINEIKSKLKAQNPSWTTERINTFLSDYLSDGYYCTETGLYGGSYFQEGKAYRALDTFCAMSKEDRDHFDYNYDAFDVLVDPTYSGRLESNYGNKPQYDGYNFDGTKMSSTALPNKVYSVTQPIDYQAEYRGETTSYKDENGATVVIEPTTTPEQWWSRVRYEDIPNEKHHYSPIPVKEPGDYFVVNKAFMRGDIPYSAGQVIEKSVYESMTAQQKANVDVLNFDESRTRKSGDEYIVTNYYYCREAYTINEKGEGQPVTTLGIKPGTTSTTYNNGQEVPQGVIISETNLSTLCNFQQNFVIHGTSPTEISTLYVSSESDIYNLSKEKIITVIYLYEYEESDASGLNVTPVSERHIVNIHVKFKSGVPEIGKLSEPSVVLPGTSVGLMTPTVSQGAFRVTDTGWEIFSNQNDADTHTNGQPFYNNTTPLYWYQNDYYLAYYAQTYLGKTYSNSVQLNVANYHDLAKVMADKEHHYYIDHKDVDREPKIYINDYSGGDNPQNGLDLFKNIIDLTYVVNNDAEGNPKAISGGPLDGHMPLNLTHKNQPMKGGQYLDFTLRTDLDHSGSSWTPIANSEGECFEGTFHGDGHTVSGLDHSLFGHLCGSVYNLGVTGSFTGAGVADTGDGYVANSWVMTTGTPDSGVKAVFGNPTATDGSTQVFNCYYPESNRGYTAGAERRQMPDASFYNGEVAYNLNGYYLNKRYYDHNTTDMGADPQTYHYFVDGTDDEGKPAQVKKEGQYGTDYKKFTYVEERYADGDFFYADGTIPETPNIRQYDDGLESHYYPIWPDDYLFFGQVLNYGHTTGVAHQSVPSSINKSETRTMTAEGGNRVYRAPAYFRSNKMEVAYYNPYAIFAQTKKGDASVKAYQNMTAIDFTGYNDISMGYKKGVVENTDGTKHFFPPLLDDDGLTGFHNIDLTQNLLAYAPDATVNQATHNVLDKYFDDLACEEEVDDETTADVDESFYRRIPVANNHSVKGHVVFKSGNAYIANRDHFLVDRQDFNCPIRYTFNRDNRMWYQRKPDNYVDDRKGWEAVSLPFSAELVTTPDKGEISHFYESSATGHEYWLREFKGGATDRNDAKTYIASFDKPEAGTAKKFYTNTFLWDYYYSHENYMDEHKDQYQKTYYQEEHVYSSYPYNGAGVPYIVGFPGSRYYEFDLSGSFVPKRTYAAIDALNSQTVTFASETGTTIEVSDDELKAVKAGGYQFVPNYCNTTLETAGTGYVLAADGGSFDRNTAGVTVDAFRPYFVGANGTRGDTVERIVFGSGSIDHPSEDPTDKRANGTLNIYTKKGQIIVESSLSYTTDVRVVSPAGITVAAFSVKSGETVTVQADFSGIYVAYTLDGRYIKKLSVDK